MQRRSLVAVVLALGMFLFGLTPAAAAERTFPETGQTVGGAFLNFFEQHGGIDIFGYPRSGEIDLNGRRVQYFQRARFEWWPENPPGQQVQLGLLAVELGRSSPPTIQSSDPNRRYFQETQHSIGGAFREFWETRGQLAVFGYPISDEQTENGFTVQYFQRARFEWHGENPPAYRVQLGLLGDEMIALGKAPIPTSVGVARNPAAGTGKLLVSTGTGGDFYFMNPDGTDMVKVGQGVDPSISPDGTKIVYGLWESEKPGLYVTDTSGGPGTLVYAGRDVRGPVFSPDMSEIAFYERYDCVRILIPPRGNFPGKNEESDCFRIKVIPSGGGTDWLPPGQSNYASAPSWSSDGSRLVFKDEKAIFVVSRTADARQLSKFEPRYATPVWSPLGGQIAVTLDQNRDHYDIGLIPDDGAVAFTQLTSSPPFVRPPVTSLSPAFSPDGQRIAFASDRDGQLRVWIMNADGSNPVRVSDLGLHSNGNWERLVSWGGR